ncbi:hypothetical protein LTR08_000522 [Meristemomyces frigidus]|nr:hypothetical protein LTR08_000522 [Meristemomyces frigidus]
MSQKRKHSPPPPPTPPPHDNIFRSPPIKDRTSTFIAYYSLTLPPLSLQTLPETKSATHRILAWRRPSAQKPLPGQKALFVSGHDDDGEKGAGRHVERVLEELGVGGALVVARWYGGVMLGPVRFTHMRDCAREAVQAWQVVVEAEGARKRAVAGAEAERRGLVGGLGERDRSIGVLRGLVGGLEGRVRGGLVGGGDALGARVEGAMGISPTEPGPIPSSSRPEATPTPTPTPTPAKTAIVDYSTMPLERLRGLDRARDATLAFLLKRIDKAEADLRALGEGGAEAGGA